MATRMTVPRGRAAVFLEDAALGADPATITVPADFAVEDNDHVGTGVPIAVLGTGYGRMIVTTADPSQGAWLQSPGVSKEDHHICEVRRLLEERPRGVFIDAGASFGCWSLALAHSVEEVITVEPQRAVYNMLCGSVALKGLSRRVFPRLGALGRVAGETPILTLDPEAPNNFGGASLNGQVPADVDVRFVERVPVWPLRDLVGPSEPVSLIKIDVEGWEWEVLMGGLEVIARWRPLLFIEWGLSDEAKLARQVEAMGYMLEYRGGNFLAVPLP